MPAGSTSMLWPAHPARRRLAMLPALVALASLLGACGGGGESAPAGATPSPPSGSAPSTPGNSAPSGPAPSTPGNPAPSDPTPADSTPTEPGDQTPQPGPDTSCGLAGFRDEALRLINERRAAGASCGSQGSFPPAAAIAWSNALTQAAYAHSKDMADRNYFAHTSPEGGTLAMRVDAAGYAWSSIGENIAAGYPTVSAVVSGWMSSPGHCSNIMSAGFREIGMACARNGGSRYGLYYTLDLATPR